MNLLINFNDRSKTYCKKIPCHKPFCRHILLYFVMLSKNSTLVLLDEIYRIRLYQYT